MDRNSLVLIRGPSGSGKTTLCRAWAGRAPYGFGLLATDEVQSQVNRPELSDDDEFALVLGRIGDEIARRLTLGPLLVDAGLRDPEHVDRVLAPAGRKRGDPDVLLVRLTVGLGEAIRRKRKLLETRVRELHEKWITRPVPGEVILPTEGLSETEVSRKFGEILAECVRQ